MTNRIRLTLVFVALALALPSCGPRKPPHEPEGPLPAGGTWAGRWQTSWGALDLVQEGTHVRGEYEYRRVKGALDGEMSNNVLNVHWREARGGVPTLVAVTSTGAGLARFVMKSGGAEFTGSWGYGESIEDGGEWSGTR